MKKNKAKKDVRQKTEESLSTANDVCGILQFIFDIVLMIGTVIGKFFFNIDMKLFGIVMVFLLLCTVINGLFIFWLKRKNKKVLEEFKEKIQEEKEEFKEKIQEENIRQIDELNKRISVCKNVIKRLLEVIEEYDKKITTLDDENKKKMSVDDENKKKLTPVQRYLIDKDLYDDFKTELKILECFLEVELVKFGKMNDKHGLLFKWNLKVENPTSKPIRMARFIYSGIKGQDLQLKVTVKESGFDKATHRKKEVIGDDCFVEIRFKNELMEGGQDEIEIAYTTEYAFKRKRDCIWLVPDELGFASMDRFRICFYSDEDIINEETKAEMQYYKLDEEYKTENAYDMIEYIEYIELKNGKKGFEVRSGNRDLLHGNGYVLELRNEDIPAN